MERRFLLFLAVSFLIVSLWARLFTPPTPEPATAEPLVEDVLPDVEESPPEPTPAEGRPAVEPPEASPEDELAVAAEPAAAAVGSKSEETVVIETSLLRLELTNRGARIVSATLKEHEDEQGRPYELVARRASDQMGVYPLDVRVEDETATERLREALYEVRRDGSEVVFRWSDGAGLEAEKVLSLQGDYTAATSVSVRRDGRELPKEVLIGAGLGMEVSESRYIGNEKGVIVPLGAEVQLLEAEDIAEGEGRATAVSATGIATHYFAALMLPVGDEVYGAELGQAIVPGAGEDPRERRVITAALAATRGPAGFDLYLGPKKVERLEALRAGLSEIIELGWMRVPALLLRAGLIRIYDVVRNYGWAIVVLTVFINLLLVPLKHYSFISMRRMQKLAPQIQHIRDRYKKVKPTDPRYQHMNQEIMALYKEHNVNPVSGCLPMLLMIPFFFAFYRLLMASVELRHAPFVLWIQDLSAYDPLFVLPILMGLSQVAIQKMTPQTTADPMQAKLMSFMPILFTFILAWAPAGLVLYWFSNNLVSMGQQVITNRYLKSQDEKAEEAQKASAKGKKKAKK